MRNLLIKILRRERKPKVKTSFSADEIKPLFESLGIDIETIGFPGMETRHGPSLDKYNIFFDKVKITPKKINDELKLTINGKYITRAQTSYRDNLGFWHPGIPSSYSFKIEDNKLYLSRRK